MRKKRDVVADRETRSIVVTKWPATDGLVPPYLMEQISDICSSNADIVNEYLQEMDHEGGIDLMHVYGLLGWQNIVINHTRRCVLIFLSFLGTFQQSEDTDPLHKWIGTYNYVRIHLMRFFRWLYNPGLPPPRPKPKVVENIPLMRR